MLRAADVLLVRRRTFYCNFYMHFIADLIKLSNKDHMRKLRNDATFQSSL